MTDEEIEKALRCCGNINVKCVECPAIQECKANGYDNTFLISDILKYINRLKANNAILKKNAAEAFQQGLNEKRNPPRNGKRGFARVKILIQGKSKRIYELGHKQSASGNF